MNLFVSTAIPPLAFSSPVRVVEPATERFPPLTIWPTTVPVPAGDTAADAEFAAEVAKLKVVSVTAVRMLLPSQPAPTPATATRSPTSK